MDGKSDTVFKIWVSVHGKPEAVPLAQSASPRTQRRLIASHFGLSPAIQIQVRTKNGELLDSDEDVPVNDEKSLYSIETKMGRPPATRERKTLSALQHDANGNAYEEADLTELRKVMRSTDLNVWDFSSPQLITLMEFMFHDLGLLQELKIDAETLRSWLVAVEHNYRTVPFHNFRHAFSVTHMMYYVIHSCNLVPVFSKMELCVLLVACICHDLDHPGLNNIYQVKAKTELSKLYNGCSPLEHHHCAVAFQLFAFDEYNIFRNLTPEVMEAVTTVLIQLILATDMALHGKILSEFQAKVKEGFNFGNPSHSLSMQKILIKCCDISNEVKPLKLSEPWVDKLLEEFFYQSDTEREEGLPVTAFMARENVRKATDQLKFIRGVLMPLYDGLSEALPVVKNVFLDSLKESEKHYERMSVEGCPVRH